MPVKSHIYQLEGWANANEWNAATPDCWVSITTTDGRTDQYVKSTWFVPYS